MSGTLEERQLQIERVLGRFNLEDVIEEAEANIGGLRSSANPTCDW